MRWTKIEGESVVRAEQGSHLRAYVFAVSDETLNGEAVAQITFRLLLKAHKGERKTARYKRARNEALRYLDASAE